MVNLPMTSVERSPQLRPMCEDTNDRHLIDSNETLDAVARQYGLSGWQGLYFCASNAAFRAQYPDPWDLPGGVVIEIPRAAEEQRWALTERMQLLNRIKRGVAGLSTRQASMLTTGVVTTRQGAIPVGGEPRLSALTRAVARTSLQAMQLLKLDETDLSRTNWALADDAVRRWCLNDRSECATLFSLVGRAGDGIAWGIRKSTAQWWCDCASPHFWGKAFVEFLRNPRAEEARLDALTQHLVAANRNAVSDVVRQLDHLYVGLVSELNELARQQQADAGTGAQV